MRQTEQVDNPHRQNLVCQLHPHSFVNAIAMHEQRRRETKTKLVHAEFHKWFASEKEQELTSQRKEIARIKLSRAQLLSHSLPNHSAQDAGQNEEKRHHQKELDGAFKTWLAREKEKEHEQEQGLRAQREKAEALRSSSGHYQVYLATDTV
jgi:hypothetical protein